jgi:alkylated DNA repair dioxygenase AlkB|tara:strand:- start:2624 stop:3010 length:387 start_codon:yes stop_codon:yes gene_type:complete
MSKILKAKIVWFPEKLTTINFDYLQNNDSINWNQEKQHLENVRSFMKQDGLLFPGVIMYNTQVEKDEIHCGHFRFRVAQEMGYDGIDAYRVTHPKDIMYLTYFSEICYKHYIELKNIKNIHKPEHTFL